MLHFIKKYYNILITKLIFLLLNKVFIFLEIFKRIYTGEVIDANLKKQITKELFFLFILGSLPLIFFILVYVILNDYINSFKIAEAKVRIEFIQPENPYEIVTLENIISGDDPRIQQIFKYLQEHPGEVGGKVILGYELRVNEHFVIKIEDHVIQDCKVWKYIYKMPRWMFPIVNKISPHATMKPGKALRLAREELNTMLDNWNACINTVSKEADLLKNRFGVCLIYQQFGIDMELAFDVLRRKYQKYPVSLEEIEEWFEWWFYYCDLDCFADDYILDDLHTSEWRDEPEGEPFNEAELEWVRGWNRVVKAAAKDTNFFRAQGGFLIRRTLPIGRYFVPEKRMVFGEYSYNWIKYKYNKIIIK